MRNPQAAAQDGSDAVHVENVGSPANFPTADVNGAGAKGAGKKYGLSV